MGRRNYQGGTFTVAPDGERLKALRGSYPKQPPQHEVEKLAGVSRGQLTRYETGKPASAQDLKKLAAFYEVDPAELLSPEGLEMCNQILEEMCLFTNKTVVANTNGNSQTRSEVPENWLDNPAAGQHAVNELQEMLIQADAEGTLSPSGPNTPEDDLNVSYEKENATNQQSLEETETIEI